MPKSITVFRILSLGLVVCLLGFLYGVWLLTFKAERQRVMEQIEQVVLHSADSIQRANLTYNNFAGYFNDARRKEKVAFAIGMTGNKGKLGIDFNDQEASATPAKDTLPHISVEKLKAAQVVFRPEQLQGVLQFDTLLRQALAAEKFHIRYRTDTFNRTGLQDPENLSLLQTRPFILNFFEPGVYTVSYHLSVWQILHRLWPYAVASLILLLLSGGALIMFDRAFRAQRQVNLFRSSLFSNATHELKTPLSSLQLILDAFQTDVPTKSAYTSLTHLSFAKTEVRRMALLVNRILAFGRMDEAQLALDKTGIALSALVEDAISALTLVTEEKKALLQKDVPDDLFIKGDAMLLVNMLITILENAMKHTTNAPSIKIKCELDSGKVLISISDNGPGIQAVYHKRIFEPFFRTPESVERGITGQGLGLSFAQQVAHLHGGDISISDSTESGTTFLISLPGAYRVEL